jgi:hypothetical protein
MTDDNWSAEETDDPLYADRRNFYKVEKWSKDGQWVEEMLFAGNSLDKARRIFERFHHEATEVEAHDQATNEGVAGVATDITGQVFGRLTVARRSDERNRDRDRLWLCRCQCGNETLVIARLLRNGATQSCGCLRRERAKNLHRLRSK